MFSMNTGAGVHESCAPSNAPWSYWALAPATPGPTNLLCGREERKAREVALYRQGKFRDVEGRKAKAPLRTRTCFFAADGE